MADCIVNIKHVATCANKCPCAVSWSECGLIAIASCNTVVVCKSESKNAEMKFKSVIKTLNEHSGQVNCVNWIRALGSSKGMSASFLLSGSADKTVVCWKCWLKEDGYEFEPITVLKGHKESITAVDGIIFSEESEGIEEAGVLIVSTGIDSTILIWKCSVQSLKVGDIALSQTIELQDYLVLTVSLHMLPYGPPILGCGLDNAKVMLYSLNTYGHKNGDESAGPSDIHVDKFCFSITLQGHEDWVRGLDFISVNDTELLLATCSQDSFVRLWKISFCEKKECSESDIDELKLRENKFKVFANEVVKEYLVHLESVLAGHDGWVYSVHWMPSTKRDCGTSLMSASMDKSIIVWEMDKDSEIWVEKVRFGEVGGNTLGFYGAQCNSEGTEIIAHSYNGALHVWEEIESDKKWKTGVAVSGHFAPVLDVAWEPKHGRFILSTSTDQTTRLFAPWEVNDMVTDSWHEIARPQIHGYDMQCLAMIDSFQFISGADEKVLRVFEAPRNFLHNLGSLSRTTVSNVSGAPEGASVPALGLSNKAVFTKTPGHAPKEDLNRGTQYIDNQFTSLVLDSPPPEEHLLQNTLWPETHKLYSHVYELFCIAANSSGTLVASASKSATPEHSAIVLWCTKSWKEVARLLGHSLTVTQLEFSHSGRFLLSVSRDRSWILHHIANNESGFSAELFAKSSHRAGHSRIIWSASWTHDDRIFCTSSRDKKIIFWKLTDDDNQDHASSELVHKVCTVDALESVTAVAFATKLTKSGEYILGAGKESGGVELYSLPSMVSQCNCTLLCKFNDHNAHSLTVKKLQWRPGRRGDKDEEYWLASCGLDHMLKITCVTIK